MNATIHKINDYVTCINDGWISVCYVVCGKEKACVIDTVKGHENLKDIVRTITDLPLVVVNTHGHIDHIYGNSFFEKAYIHADDVEIHDRAFAQKQAATKEQVDQFGATEEYYKWYISCGPCPLEFTKPGDVFDLGGITLEVVNLRGHTKGSIGLLDKKGGLFFSGDALNIELWMQLPDSTSLREMQETLRNLEPYRPFIKELHTGHNVEKIDPSMIDQIIECVDDLYENGGENDEMMNWFMGKSPAHRFKNACILYNPERL